MKRAKLSLLLAMLLAAAGFSSAHAISSYQTSFRNTYPAARGSAIDNCTLCHPGGNTGSRNSYANAYAGAGHAYAAIESRDSDGDGFTNLAEITAFTYPGDAASRPSTPPANRAPVANAGGNQTVISGARVTLNGSGSSDSDGTITTYLWRQTGGSPTVTLSSSSAVSPTFTAPSVTASSPLTFTLTVTDNGGLQASATCTVTVNPGTPPANTPPVANAGANQTVTSGATVTLTGSGSSDPDGTISTYLWAQTGGSPSVTLSSTSAVSPTFRAPSVSARSTLTFTLTVTDNGGLQSSASCTVTINPSGSSNNLPPVANAGLDLAVLPGSMVNLDGFYSTDSDNGIASYAWTQTGGTTVTLSDPTTADPIFQAPSTPGVLTFRLIVTDNGGLQSSDTCTVTVLSADASSPEDSANQPPVANAGQDRSVDAGVRVSLSGTGSTDPDDGVASYQWSQTSGPTVTLSGANRATASFVSPRTRSGTRLVFRLTVKDKAGQSASDTVTITVEEDDD